MGCVCGTVGERNGPRGFWNCWKDRIRRLRGECGAGEEGIVQIGKLLSIFHQKTAKTFKKYCRPTSTQENILSSIP